MKAPSLNELKTELNLLHPAELVKLCLRLARFKKENKELLDYLLFDSNYEPAFIIKVKEEIDRMFREINRSSLYFAKKSIRKILRATNKYIRYSGQKKTEVELRIHFCMSLKQSGLPLRTNTVLFNIFDTQMLRISKALEMLHEDLQHDYREEIRRMLE